MIQNEIISESQQWIKEQITQIDYGEVSIKLILHAGRVRKIEKTVTTKLQESE